MSHNNWFTVEEIDKTTFAISEYGHEERVHSFLFLGATSAALIDTGLGVENIKAIVDSITTLPVVVITTHAHWDHIGGHSLFDNIAIHKKDAKWLEQGIPLPDKELERALGEDKFTTGKLINFDLSKYIVHRGKPQRLLMGGETINLGFRELQIIHTPGHSPGHICVYEPKTGYLATGDLLYEGTIYCNFESTNPQQFLSSINKIATLNVTKILPGHNNLQLSPAQIKKTLSFFIQLDKEGKLHHGVGLCDNGEVIIAL